VAVRGPAERSLSPDTVPAQALVRCPVQLPRAHARTRTRARARAQHPDRV